MRSTDRAYAFCLNTFWLSVVEKDVIGRELLLSGVWEYDLSIWMKKNVEPGSTCIDAGSNVGYFTEIMARRSGPTGKVYAIEANEIVTNAYLSAQRLNDYTETAEIFVTTAALTDEDDQTVTFRVPRENEGAATLLDEFGYPYHESAITTFTAPTARLDGLIGPGPIDLVKIDLEASEPAAFRGAGSVLDRARRLVMEIHPLHPFEFLEELNDRYRAFDLAGRSTTIRRSEYGSTETLVLEQR